MKCFMILLLNLTLSQAVLADYTSNCSEAEGQNFSELNLSSNQIMRILNASSGGNEELLDTIFEIIDNGDIEGLKKLLTEGLDPNTCIDGDSILWQLGTSCSIDNCSQDEIDRANSLLETVLKYSKVKVDIDDRDGIQNTPLMWAALDFNHKAMDLMLTYGADPSLVDHENLNILGHFRDGPDKKSFVPTIKSLEVLKKHGFDINQHIGNGSSFSYKMSRSFNDGAKFVEALINIGVNIDKPNKYGLTALMIVDKFKTFKIMVEQGKADYNRIDKNNGRTILAEMRKQAFREDYEFEDTLKIIEYLESIGAKE